MAEQYSNQIPIHVKDLTGRQLGSFTFVRLSHVQDSHAYWICRCVCGNEQIRRASRLTNGSNCGCASSQRKKIHGLAGTKEYMAWNAAYRRCYEVSDKGYPYYGGRGITMSDEWKESVKTFVSDMGPCPAGYTLERIDVNGNYTKSNCKWIPRPDQARNRRNTIKITRDGETKSLREWARHLGIPYMTVLNRYHRGLELFARGRIGSPWNKGRKSVQ